MAEMRYAPGERSSGRGSMRWWDRKAYPTERVFSAIQTDVEYIRKQQRQQRDTWVYCMSLYGGGNVSGLEGDLGVDGGQVIIDTDQYWQTSGRTRFNLAAALADTVISLIVHSPAIPIVMSTGADFATVRKARKKTQILQGQCKEVAAWEEKLAMIDACKVGTGFMFDYVDHSGAVAFEHVHPLQVFIEHTDGLSGKPRAIHRTKLVSRDELSEAYESKAAEIWSCESERENVLREHFISRADPGGCHVQVIESWYCATSRKKGRHVISIANATLLDEEFDGKEIDDVCAVFRYRERDKGFFGIGVIERHVSSQLRIDQCIKWNDRGQDLCSNVVFATPVPPGEVNPSTDQYTNEIGQHVYVPGLDAPQVIKWEGTMYDLQDQVDREFQRCLLVEGVTAEQVGGEAQAGKSSGVAVRAADDIQSRRLLRPVENFQDGCIQAARLLVRANDRMASEDGEYKVRGRTQTGASTFLETAKWRELMDIDEMDARIEMMPMSALPTTPQGKWAAVMEWIDRGFIDQNHGMQLMEMPDISSYADMMNAFIDFAKWQVERILEGDRILPDPEQDLGVAINIAKRSLMRLVMMKPEVEIEESLRAFINQTRALQLKAAQDKQQQAPAAPPAGGMPAGPPPGPMPPGPPGAPPGMPPPGAPGPGPAMMPPGMAA